MPQLGELGVAVLFHQPRDVVATPTAASLAFDREGRDEKIRQRVGVVSHGLSGQLFGSRSPASVTEQCQIGDIGGNFGPPMRIAK
jgi:hypothetical protein